MIIVPEIKTVVILVPRTGSGSLKRAVLARYPQAMELYRHMEADGVPFGYDRGWRKVGVVRHPIERLWSLYKFLSVHDFGDGGQNEMFRRSVNRPFDEWILTNDTPFQGGGVHAVPGLHPLYSVRWVAPENRKSQHVYLRPDLGTSVYRFAYLDRLARDLDITLPRVNGSPSQPVPSLSLAARAHLREVFAWDFNAC